MNFISYIFISLLFLYARCQNMQKIVTSLNESVVISCDAREFDHMRICWISTPKGKNLLSYPPGQMLDNGRIRGYGDKYQCWGEILRVNTDDIGEWTCFFAMRESSKTVIRFSNVLPFDKNASSLTKYQDIIHTGIELVSNV